MKYAKRLDPSFVRTYERATPAWGPLGYVTYKRTYARATKGRLEEWYETCARVCNGLIEIGGKFTGEELQELYNILFYFKGSVSGRALWQLGTETVLDVGADSLQNCWHVLSNKLSSFTFAMNQLMLGGGVGANVLPEYVYELPPVKFNPTIERVDSFDCDFIVTDNREGWVELIGQILESFFITGKRLTYNVRCVRSKGSPIKRFGGTASGPEPLTYGVTKIVEIIRGRLGQKLRPIDCVDIFNLIGTIVVSGNVRRSSEIMIGDPFDRAFLNAKNWGKITVPDWRTMSNNTIAADTFEDINPAVWEGYNGNGEPYGFVSLKNCREFGRLIEPRNINRDPYVVGLNPCGEITLNDREPCNLAEIFLPNINSHTEFKKVAGLLFKACKTITNFRYSDKDVQEVVRRNHRIGVGLSGFMQSPKFHEAKVLDDCYRHLVKVDEEVSKLYNCPLSIKRTTMKPSGTLSLLPGCLPGIAASLGDFVIRTVRFAANNPLVKICEDHGYPVEPRIKMDGSEDPTTVVISFPATYKGIHASSLTIQQALDWGKFVQTYWSDNSVSVTHYYRPEDVTAIQDWFRSNYDSSIKSVSFLLESGHGFKQAPIQPVTEAEYDKLLQRVKPIVHANIPAEILDYDLELECTAGVCSVR